MFLLKQNTTFEWPVKVLVPTSGRKTRVEFKAEFNVVDSETHNELLVESNPPQVMRFLQIALVRTEDIDIEDENGDQVDDDEHRNEILLGNPIFAQGIMDAFIEGSKGKAAKN